MSPRPAPAQHGQANPDGAVRKIIVEGAEARGGGGARRGERALERGAC